GMTVNSFTSVSLNPPLGLVCIQNNLRILSLIRSAGAFAISVLRADQSEWSQHFATPSTEVLDRLAGYETFTAATGMPILKGALGYFDCQVEAYHSGGTHTIIVAHVLDAKREEGEPLVYWNRDYRILAVAS
ncbi:MAG TPA: flavin reductase family protein, partial [Anaerolineales bacterium]|nr:flavin reductase family protein [Anaerolineales bacterium]